MTTWAYLILGLVCFAAMFGLTEVVAKTDSRE